MRLAVSRCKSSPACSRARDTAEQGREMTDLNAIVQPVTVQLDYTNRIRALGQATQPTLFGMRAHLPSSGRTDMPLAATPRMSVILKTYAEGGENGLHCHSYEDHSFIVLQGEAVFHGDDGEIGRLRRHQGILLPSGVYYRFQAEPGEPLVIIRFGAVIGEDVGQYDRTDTKGASADGWDARNKTVSVVLTDQIFE